MNVEWCLARLDEAEQLINAVRFARYNRDADGMRLRESQLSTAMVPVKRIAARFDPQFNWPPAHASADLLLPGIAAIRGELNWAKEIKENLEPTAPQLAADRFHSWVWDGARSLWDSGHFADAVLAAAKHVNARLQNKICRRDISDSQLCGEAFALAEPKPQGARLRFNGDRSSESWKARQQGALELSKGAFKAIRNPLAHTDGSDMVEQEALELLAVFSVVARWIDECVVERAP